ncbi:MAG: CRTAC1 family protein [Planctomycetia bacterium]|nr:CRTAC1 family protein [Planctomycetia bacterium]
MQNDGQGRFTDVTAASGLDAKRNRRTFSASLIDLNGDGSLDLVTVNDFSGMDVYSNDGRGKFTDVTDSWLDERHAFGMSHTIGDYDRDGRLDLYMIGMSSTTARRLDAMGLKRTDSPAEHKMRAAMGYGNRMYLAGGKGYRQAPFNDQVARTGWSWGSATLDWDNDGDRDIFVGNGHISRGTAKDYCTRFWCHDIYFNTPRPDPELKRFVQDVVADEMQSMSWNGYEHDCLLLNEGGRGFRDVGFLLGVGFEFDSRNVAAQDLDLDGRVDLIVAEKRLSDGPLLHILQNTAPYKRHWIGVVLRDYGKGRSPLGAQVAARTASARHVGVVVAGDSFQSQHAPVVHFGLGEESQVEELEVRWPDGAVSRLANPTVDRYHRIKPPDAGE